MHLRRERPADELVEARLTEELREDVGLLPHLSLVAVVDGSVAGHVRATRGRVEPLGCCWAPPTTDAAPFDGP